MIAGFVALMISHSRVLPVSRVLYPTESECHSALLQDKKQRPQTDLLCGEVLHSNAM